MTNVKIILSCATVLTMTASSLPILVRPLSCNAGTTRRTDGGLAGSVFRVTTLNAKGPGSLRAAIESDQPRLVVFEVGGVIDLEGRTLVVRHPFLTIAGQTAPDPGITIIRGGLVVETHAVVIQHISVRPGDNGRAAENWSPDALGVRRGASPVHDVVFDHCSATWAIDENLSTSGPADAESADATAHDITLRYCLIAEGLSNSTHPKGEHSKGTLVHDGVRNVAIIGCLYAHNRERNPRLKGGTTAVVMDTLMYNWGSAAVGVGARGAEKMLQPAEAILAGNVAIAGPDTRGRVFVKSHDPGARLFLHDNIAVSATGTPLRMTDDQSVLLTEPPVWSAPIPRTRPWENAARVLRSAGSRPARRDPIDARIVASVIRGDGRIIDSQEQVGGYPVRATTKRAVVVPDGVSARRRWLEALSTDLGEDKSLDTAPLLRRLSSAAPSPGSRR